MFLLPIVIFAQEAKEYETPHYKERVAYFAENPIGENKIVFLGNSLTEGGKWDEYFPAYAVVNRGISGDNTEGMLNRIDEIIAARPLAIFILTGINDISQNLTNKQILANYRMILERIKTESPNTVIFVESLTPINNDFQRYKKLIGKEKQVLAFNKSLKKLCKQGKVGFLDIHFLFKGKDGKLREELTRDGLHFNEAGYKIWSKYLNEQVKLFRPNL
jgi:lysophospholipase L1-like esterase